MRSIALNKRAVMALLVVGGAAACVDAPSAPLAAADQNPLATSLEMLAEDQMNANDVERSEEFRWAALALRAGVTPSVVEVTNDGNREVYDGFVHAVTWVSLTQALRPPLHRSLVAWRRSGDVLQVLLVGMFTDSAPVLHPYSLRPASPGTLTESPIAGATAAYFERGPVNSSWVGIGGVAKVAEHPQLMLCPSPNDPSRPQGVTCQLTRFGVRLNVLFARTRSRDSREVDVAAPTRRLIAPDQTVAGAKLVFACAMPLSTGCN
jgi:hypothetical protein